MAYLHALLPPSPRYAEQEKEASVPSQGGTAGIVTVECHVTGIVTVECRQIGLRELGLGFSSFGV